MILCKTQKKMTESEICCYIQNYSTLSIKFLVLVVTNSSSIFVSPTVLKNFYLPHIILKELPGSSGFVANLEQKLQFGFQPLDALSDG